MYNQPILSMVNPTERACRKIAAYHWSTGFMTTNMLHTG